MEQAIPGISDPQNYGEFQEVAPVRAESNEPNVQVSRCARHKWWITFNGLV